MGFRIALLHESHGAKKVFTTFLLYEAAHKQNQLGIALDMDGMKPITIDARVVHVQFGLRKASLQGGVPDESGDADKCRGLLKQAISVSQVMTAGKADAKRAIVGGDIEAMERNHEWDVEPSGYGQRLNGIDGKMGMNDGSVDGPQAADEVGFHGELAIKIGSEFIDEAVAVAKQEIGLRIVEGWTGTTQTDQDRTVATQAPCLIGNERLARCEKAFAKYERSVHRVITPRKRGEQNERTVEDRF